MQKIITEKICGKSILLLQGDVNATDTRLAWRFNHSQNDLENYHVWIDCSSVDCIKTHGFCHFVNQLLLIKAAGMQITLLDLELKHKELLAILQVDHLFAYVPGFEMAYELMQAV